MLLVEPYGYTPEGEKNEVRDRLQLDDALAMNRL